jgi:hypothetical protein
MTILDRSIAAALLITITGGCSSQAPSGYDEPLRVFRSTDSGRVLAQFFEGRLPDSAQNADASSMTATDSTVVKVTQFLPPNNVILPGYRGSNVRGRLSTNASAVALSFDTGTGYWVVPAGVPDSSSDDELTWLAICDYSPEIAAGFHELTAVAVDANGTFGGPVTQKLCFTGQTAAGLNACVSTIPPPVAVISLSWETNVDLDLVVVPPSADRIVSPKHPATMDRNADGTLPDEAGVMDRDSNAGCVNDGLRTENLVFDKVKPQGTWAIYANLFDSCKQPVVNFAVRIYVSRTDGVNEKDQTLYHLEQVGERFGTLLGTQANGDSGALGTYLFEVDF